MCTDVLNVSFVMILLSYTDFCVICICQVKLELYAVISFFIVLNFNKSLSLDCMRSEGHSERGIDIGRGHICISLMDIGQLGHPLTLIYVLLM